MGNPTTRSARWPFLAAAAAVYFGGRALPLPGIDHEYLLEVTGSDGGLLSLFQLSAGTPLCLVGMTVSALVLVQLALAAGGALERPLARRIGLVVYLGVCAAQGLATALWAEGVDSYEMFGTLVPSPGVAFRLTTTLGLTAGGALLWWVTGRLDRARAATGFAFLALLHGLAGALGDATRTGALVAGGQLAPIHALARLALPLATLIVGAALVVRPARYPRKLLGPIALTSAWDALAIPAVVAIPFAAWMSGVSAARLLRPSHETLPELVAGAAELGVAVAVAVWLLRQPRDAGAGRDLGPALLAALGLGAWVAGASLSFTAAAGGADLWGPGPLSGDASFTLVLEAEGRFADGDATRMLEKIEALGAEARLESADARHITLHVEGASTPEAVADALQPHVLELSFTLERGDDPLGGALATVPSGDWSVDRIRGWRGPCDEIEHLLLAPPAGCDVPALEAPRDPQYEADCTLHCLEPELVLSSADVASAVVRIDPQMGSPIIAVELTSGAAQRFADATGSHLHRALAIVVDGEVVSAPVVQSRIDGGHVQITLGALEGFEAQRAEAEALAAALGPGPHVSTPFVIAEVR